MATTTTTTTTSTGPTAERASEPIEPACPLCQGERVRLTAKFLRNTGQYSGREPLSVWTIQACECELCSTGRFVATDQIDPEDGTRRHINVGNLERATAADLYRLGISEGDTHE